MPSGSSDNPSLLHLGLLQKPVLPELPLTTGVKHPEAQENNLPCCRIRLVPHFSPTHYQHHEMLSGHQLQGNPSPLLPSSQHWVELLTSTRVSGWAELIFFLVSGTIHCFGFRRKPVMVTQRCLTCC